MLQIDISNTSITIEQLLNKVEKGSEITIVRDGKPIARLSPVLQPRQPLASRRELRAIQTQSSTPTLEILQSIRQEARY